jgi:alpha-galactosidase
MATYTPVAELPAHPACRIYAEGWQSWSPTGARAMGGPAPLPSGECTLVMGYRSDRPPPPVGHQGEGLLAVELPGGETRLWLAADAAGEIPSLRASVGGDVLVVSADGPVEELCEHSLEAALAAAGERLGVGSVHASGPGPGWCSWYEHFKDVTDTDVLESLDAARRLELPFSFFQVDDGWQAGIGDWTETSARFGDLDETITRIRAAGLRAGLWTAPFLVGSGSRLAREHPDWLVGDAWAGENWDQPLHVLDVTHPDAAEHLEAVYRGLAVEYHKLDFLYAGALPGRRHGNASALDAYREGLRIVRRGAGPDATLLACGAPLLPSIGLVDAMRVGPDVLGEHEREPGSIDAAIAASDARRWTNGRLWTCDPDCLVVRPEIRQRERWAEFVSGYGGLVVSSDRLAALDARGVELLRTALET